MLLSRLRPRSDEQLVTAFRRGDESAFEDIHGRYRERLSRYVRQMLRTDSHAAEDVVQDVWVRAYRGLRTNDRDMHLRPWLYRIATNRTMDVLRAGTPVPAEMSETLAAAGGAADQRAESREHLREIFGDIQRLPERQRAALTLRELEGISYQEIGEALDVTVPAVKSLLVRARIGLAEAAEARATPAPTPARSAAAAAPALTTG